MFKVGKKYKVRDLNYFKNNPENFIYRGNKILAANLPGTEHFMTSSMLRKKEVTIHDIFKSEEHVDFITIEEDGFVWEPWMLVPLGNTIMETE